MSNQLLTLSFHAPKVLLAEDIFFKKHSIASGLIASEVLGDGSDIPVELLHNDKYGTGSGLSTDKVGGTTQVSFNKIGFNSWWRKEYKSKTGVDSEFEKWIRPKIEQNCQCLLLSGHHAITTGTSEGVVLWGKEDTRIGAADYRYFTALIPSIDTNDKTVMEVYGHPYRPSREAVLRAGPFDFSKTLEECRLIVVMGCNGTGWRKGVKTRSAGKIWQKWVEKSAGVKPIVLGWYGSHSMPKDRLSEHFSQKFWEGLKTLSLAHGLSFDELCKQKSKDVIKIWGMTLKEIFSNSSTQKHLWFGGYKGAGAIDIDGKEWRVLDKDGPIKRIE